MSKKRRGAKERLLIYADGSIRAEKAGAGIAVVNDQGEIIKVQNRTLPAMTSNEAEYAALILALETAIELAAKQVEIRMDNEVVICQMLGRFGVNSARLKGWHQKACALARQLPRITYTFVPRQFNALADALASEGSAGRQWQSGSWRA